MSRLTQSLSILFSLAICSTASAQTPVQPSGSGTVNDPYLVSSLSNLAWIQDAANDTAWNSHFVQTANIDASSDSTWNSGTGFSPIGTYPGAYFGGTYDGGGHTITGLSISRASNDYIGLFGYTQDATISNLGLVNVNIIGEYAVGGLGGEFFQNTTVKNCSTSGNISGTTYVGGLIGWVETGCIVTGSYSNANVSASSGTYGGLIGWNDLSSIDSCYSTGNVGGTGSSNGGAGGLIGSNSSSNVSHSYTTSAVTAPGSGTSYVGGFVGSNSQTDTVSSCSSSGTVTCSGSIIGGFFGSDVSSTTTNSFTTSMLVCDPSSNWVGGFAGQISGSADSNCYSTGSLTGSLFVGGFAGEAISNTLVNKCYSLGRVNGSGLAGGFVGYVSSASIDSCFWNVDSSGWSTSAGGEGKSDAEMKTGSTYTNSGWDFTGIWDVNSSKNNGYPYLQWQNPGETPLPIQLASFSAMAQRLNGVLKWQTFSELNNDGWVVERKKTADFELPNANWVSAGFVRGGGTSTKPTQYSFVDQNLPPGQYLYRLKQIDLDGSFKYSQVVQVEVGLAPKAFSLSQNYPNPFNPTTTIEFALPTDGHVLLKVYDVRGRDVATLVDGQKDAGVYQATFLGAEIASGVYFYRLSVVGNDGHKFVSTKRSMLIK